MTTYWDESYPPSVLFPAQPPTGATAGTPGTWTPDGADIPSSVADANALGLDLGAAWPEGSYVVLDNASQTHAYWDGTKFVSGEAPAPIVIATGATAGSPGTWTPAGSVPPASFADAALASVTATPSALWSAGQYVVLGDVSHAYWDGAAWVVGDGPAALRATKESRGNDS
jgi:hypothetical protein